jgi:hypothetical protein
MMTRSTPASAPCAASWLLRKSMTGPVRDYVVVATSPYAVYARAVDQAETPQLQDVLAIGDASALPIPFMTKLPTGLAWPIPALRTGAVIRCGDGAVVVGDATLTPRRWWQPPHVRPGRPPLAGTVAAVETLLAGRTLDDGDVLRAAAAGLSGGSPSVANVRALLGRGAGLTPSGDDVICGVLLGLVAFGGPAPTRVEASRAAVEMSAERTTAVSAALIRCAAEGYALPAVVELVMAVQADDVAALPARCAAVFAIGHESGTALVVGLAAAARAVLSGAVAA